MRPRRAIGTTASAYFLFQILAFEFEYFLFFTIFYVDRARVGFQNVFTFLHDYLVYVFINEFLEPYAFNKIFRLKPLVLYLVMTSIQYKELGRYSWYQSQVVLGSVD